MAFLVPMGLAVVHKPPGKTSADVVAIVKRIIGGKTKVGHGGTLDKDAQGVLVLGIGTGCSLLPQLLSGDKRYLAKGCLGVETDTYDASGHRGPEQPFAAITRTQLEGALARFTGPIQQRPPPFSALKVKGRRMSDLVLAGIAVDPKPRPVVAHAITLTSFEPPLFKFGRQWPLHAVQEELWTRDLIFENIRNTTAKWTAGVARAAEPVKMQRTAS